MTETIDDQAQTARTGGGPSPIRSKSSWLVLAGVGLAIALAIGIVSSMSGGGGESEPTGVPAEPEASTPNQEPTAPPEQAPPEPAAPAISPEEITRVFIEASTAEEGAAAAALLAIDAEIDLAGLNNAADAEAWFAWNRAIGFQATATGCETNSSGDLLCRYTYDSPWMSAAGIDPASGNSMTFTIEDGVITAVSERFRFDPFAPVWDGFKAWVRRSHPGTIDLIITSDDQPVLTPEAIERWELFSSQFVDSFALQAVGERFVDAFLSFDSEQLERVAGTARDLHEELYLQGFSAAANYAVTERGCEASVLRVNCTITGSDDIGAILGVTYTDGFSIEVAGDRTILAVVWSTDSAPEGVFDAYFEWLQSTQPELFQAGGACDGFFDRGTTPEACGAAWLAAAASYDPDA